MSGQNPTAHGTVLQSVRRKLAALFGSAYVHPISIGDNRPIATVRRITLSSVGFPIRFGASIGVVSASLLPAGRALDITRIPVKLASDAVAGLTSVQIHRDTMGTIVGKSEQMTIGGGALPDIHQAEMMTQDIGMVKMPPHSLIASPPVHARDVARPLPLTKADRRAVSLAIKQPRIGLVPQRVAAEITLERRREPMLVLEKGKPPIGFDREMTLLRAASGELDADIKLVGVYCCVPIGAASRLEFDPSSGSLMLNIREGAFETIATAKRPVVTLVLGQIVSTGRMLRAFGPEST